MHDQSGIAIVVSTHQRPEHLRRCLVSIALQRDVNASMEVVVADDGSTDHTPQVVAEFARSAPFPVRFTTHPHEGFHVARSRNEGARASSSPYVLFVDGDCVLPPDHLAQQLKHRRRGCALLGDCYRLDQPTSERITDAALRTGEFVHWAPAAEVRRLRTQWLKFWYYTLIRHPSKPRLISNNVGVWRSDLEAVNGFDEKFIGWGCEDDDFGLRLRQAGVRFKSILPWTRLYHLWHPLHPTVPKEHWKDGANAAYMLRPHRRMACLDGLVKHSIEVTTSN